MSTNTREIAATNWSGFALTIAADRVAAAQAVAACANNDPDTPPSVFFEAVPGHGCVAVGTDGHTMVVAHDHNATMRGATWCWLIFDAAIGPARWVEHETLHVGPGDAAGQHTVDARSDLDRPPLLARFTALRSGRTTPLRWRLAATLMRADCPMLRMPNVVTTLQMHVLAEISGAVRWNIVQRATGTQNLTLRSREFPWLHAVIASPYIPGPDRFAERAGTLPTLEDLAMATDKAEGAA